MGGQGAEKETHLRFELSTGREKKETRARPKLSTRLTVAAEEHVHLARIEDGVDVGVGSRLHCPVLVHERHNPRGHGAVDGGQVGLEEGELVRDELGARRVGVGLRGEDDEVHEALREAVEALAVGAGARAGAQGDGVHARAVLREVAVAVLEGGDTRAGGAGLVVAVRGHHGPDRAVLRNKGHEGVAGGRELVLEVVRPERGGRGAMGK